MTDLLDRLKKRVHPQLAWYANAVGGNACAAAAPVIVPTQHYTGTHTIGGPDKDMQDAVAEIERLTTENERMRDTLLMLDRRGGLGFDKHEQIKRALGVAYPSFCRHSAECAGKGRCMAETVCNN